MAQAYYHHTEIAPVFGEGPAADLMGLQFPIGNDTSESNTNSVRFRFTGAALPPIYGTSGAGLTYLWKFRPMQQTGYYTSFFWGNDDGAGTINDTFLWKGGPGGTSDTFYGCHPYPHNGSAPLFGTGLEHRWEISVEGNDPVDADDPVSNEAWYSQALRAWGATGVAKQHEYYWNLPDVTSANRVTYTSGTTYGDTAPPSPALTFGDPPWQPSKERLGGVLRGLQIYNALLSTAQIVTLGALETDADVLAKVSELGISGLWYLNMNPADESDISDKSGAGHHPAWWNSNRPLHWPISMDTVFPTYDNSAKNSSTTPAATLSSTSFAISGSNRVLYVGVASGAAATVTPSTVKWNTSESLTQISSTLNIGSSSFGKFSVWRLINPTATTSTVDVVWPSNQDERAVIAVSFKDANQTTPNDTVGTGTGTNLNPIATGPSVLDNLVLNFVHVLSTTGSSSLGITANGSQSSKQEIEGSTVGGFHAVGASTLPAGGATTAMSWTTVNMSGGPSGWGSFTLALKGV